MCVCVFLLSATPFSLSSPNRDGKVFSFSTLQEDIEDDDDGDMVTSSANEICGWLLAMCNSAFHLHTYALPPRVKMTFNFHVFHCECFVKVKSSGRWTFFSLSHVDCCVAASRIAPLSLLHLHRHRRLLILSIFSLHITTSLEPGLHKHLLIFNSFVKSFPLLTHTSAWLSLRHTSFLAAGSIKFAEP